MAEAVPLATSVLLEPILSVDVPSEAMSRTSAILSGRRGWDLTRALLPEAEMAGLIVELRSASAGVGSFCARFDHRAELAGKPADAFVKAQSHARSNSAGQIPATAQAR